MMTLRERMAAARNTVVTPAPVETTYEINPVVVEKSIPRPKKAPVPENEKLPMLFGDWVSLVRHHNVHTHGNQPVEITKSIQHALWVAYNIDAGAFNALHTAKKLPNLP